MDLIALKNDTEMFRLGTMLFGTDWSGARLKGLPSAGDDRKRRFEQNDVRFYGSRQTQPKEGSIDLEYEVKRQDANSLRIRYICEPEFDTTFGIPGGSGKKRDAEHRVAVGPVLGPQAYFEGGSCELTFTDRSTERTSLPPANGLKSAVVSALLRTVDGETITFAFDPPAILHVDRGQMRFFADQQMPAGQLMTQSVTLSLFEPISFEPANRLVRMDDWFPLNAEQANDRSSPGVLGMHSWQEKPAGKHGFLQMEDDRLQFADGTPVKFWGVNPLKVNQKVDEAYLADSAAALEHLGVNLVRFHAFAKPNVPNEWAHMLKIQDVNDGMKFNDRHLALLDYGFARMKDHGVYSGWSVFYGWIPTQADEQRVINWGELQTMIRQGFPARGSFYEATGVLPDIQDLMIQFHVKLLNHVNPHTGRRYADDPALAYIELQNEENVFLAARNYDNLLKNAPTYRTMFYQRFANWLRTKYPDQESLRQAWGNRLKNDETLDAANISPFPQWYQGLPDQRTADQLHFLYTTQREYYQRFEAAVRAAGYQGLVVGSCWQSADWVGHLFNVLSDRDIGLIDRHNYNVANLRAPGQGLLSAGFQAVLDRPFNFSEWSGGAMVGQTLDVPLVAIYGMGLQGWDASLQFAWDYPGVLPYKSSGVNNSCNDFGALSQYPALARMVRRGDVQEGAVVGSRRVSLPSLKTDGDVGFTEQFSLLGGANNKSFNAAVPSAALAAGRVVLEYVDGPVEEPVVDSSTAWIDTQNRLVRSSTDQLRWDYSDRGVITVDTPGTKAVIGYGGGKTHHLGPVTIAPQSPFCQLYVTALDREETIGNAKRLLITATARMVDRGTVFDEFSERPLVRSAPRTGPALIEPVKASIGIEHSGTCRVFALDHGGHRREPDMEVPVEKRAGCWAIALDGRRDKTIYYLVELE
jgi:hypothetical protein